MKLNMIFIAMRSVIVSITIFFLYLVSANAETFHNSATVTLTNPVLVSPLNNTVFESGTTSVDLVWEFNQTEPPSFVSFSIEYTVNGTLFTETVNDVLTSPTLFSLTSLPHASYVEWRVCGIDEGGVRFCSVSNFFTIRRSHPLMVAPDGTGNGTSWSNPIGLQSALNNYIFGDELWLKEGKYKPTNTFDRTQSFRLREGIRVFGGFSGVETAASQRNWLQYPSILSGDIGNEGDFSDNSNNVVLVLGTTVQPITSITLIDGVIIESGFGNVASSNRDRGAGMFLTYASPTIVNTIFRNNSVINFGGAVHGDGASAPHFYNTVFVGNNAGSFGGAVHANTSMRFVNCVFYGNTAGERGGAISGPITQTNVIVDNSIAWANSAPNFSQLYKATVSYSIVEGGHIGVGMVTGNPGFLNPENQDFRLNYLSAARNTGSNEKVPLSLTEDFGRLPRIGENRVDIGVFEGFVNTPFPKLPAENHLFSSQVELVDVEWHWLVAQPSGIDSYMVEYKIDNSFSSEIDGVIELSAEIPGLLPTNMVKWRVAAIDQAANEYWSPWAGFSILRDHPLYVTSNASGSGSSWSDPVALQDALAMSVFGDQLWIAAGTYLPTQGSDRNISFELKDGIHLIGGFAGNESFIEERDILANRTILSGDIGTPGNNADNSFHVLKAFGTSSEPITNATLIDGFIVEGGNAELYINNNQHAGGLYLSFASPRVFNSWFRNNYSKDNGGAVHGDNGSNPVFANVIFSDNIADRDGGAVFSNASMLFYNCLWYNNYSFYWGGSASASTSQTTLIYNSISWGNRAWGGYNDFRNIRIRNSLVEDGSGIQSIILDPLFVNASIGDFRLMPHSPAIDAGSDSWVPAWLTTDFVFNNRVQGISVDMGPFESIPNSSSLWNAQNEEKLLTVLPNPVSSGNAIKVQLNVSSGSYQIVMKNLAGQVLHEMKLNDNKYNGSIYINVPSGIYLIHASGDNGIEVVQKLMVR
jgi:predicted outer membrane repeat protein